MPSPSLSAGPSAKPARVEAAGGLGAAADAVEAGARAPRGAGGAVEPPAGWSRRRAPPADAPPEGALAAVRSAMAPVGPETVVRGV